MDVLYQVMRLPYIKGLWSKFPVGSIQNRVEFGIFPYPHYAYGVYWSAYLASRLGIPRISVIEFGVAGGRGLVALEKASLGIGRALGVGIDVVGFDSGEGMPEARDYRDLPHIWGKGFYRMDQEKLRGKLAGATLILGDVSVTAPAWISAPNIAPIGFVAFDLDYYSSTVAAFRLFEGKPATHLPRVHCYFDDVASNAVGCMNEYVGELLAIREFNDAHADKKICKIQQIRLHRTTWERWQDKMFAFHDFAHEHYTTHVFPPDHPHTQLPL